MGLLDLFSSKKKKTILILEDDIHLMSNHKMFFENDRQLNEVYNFEFAQNREEYQALIKNAEAIISDYYMGDLRFEDVWLECAGRKLPLILMTGEITKKFTGAQIFKPVKYTVLKNIVLDIFNPKFICPKYEPKKSSSSLSNKKIA
jgi:DNA-binding NtrC family response regulator